MVKSKSEIDRKEIGLAALAWYDRERRELPWRASPGARADPYAVWLSEIMLQQTTVAAVKAYYQRFLVLWPRVQDLARAPLDDVLKAWAGLGYYSRARNLHACARKVVADHGGVFPGHEADLRLLPGVGPYTAAAVAAIAFNRPAAVVDGNVERVAARLLALETPLPAAKKEIAAFVSGILPTRRPGDFAQAMMDLGATVCTPRTPACMLCPLARFCAARAARPQDFPRKPAKKARPFRRGAVFVLRRADGAFLVRRRPERGLLGGMTEFFGTDWRAERDEDWGRNVLRRAAAPCPATDWRLAGEIDHVFTHFALRLAVHVAESPQDFVAAPDGFWLDKMDMRAAALPTVMRKAEICALKALGLPAPAKEA